MFFLLYRALEFEFLSILPGDTVAIRVTSLHPNASNAIDYVALVLHVINSPRDPSCPSLIQVVDIDTGRISIVNADLVIGTFQNDISL